MRLTWTNGLTTAWITVVLLALIHGVWPELRGMEPGTLGWYLAGIVPVVVTAAIAPGLCLACLVDGAPTWRQRVLFLSLGATTVQVVVIHCFQDALTGSPWKRGALVGALVLSHALVAWRVWRDREAFKPDWVSHPGETVRDLMDEHGWGADDLAVQLGCDAGVVESLLDGERDVDPELADGLSRALGFSREFWLRRQAHYDAGRGVLQESPRPRSA